MLSDEDIEDMARKGEKRWNMRGDRSHLPPELPLRTLDLAELAKMPAKAVEFGVERLAPLGEVTGFYAPGGGCKSLLAQQLCTVAAAALGSCLGLAVASGPALYVTYEDGGEHVHFRQEKVCAALGIDMASLAGKLHLVSLRGELDNELEGKDDDGNYAPSAAYRRLSGMVRATGAKLVALDNVAHLFAGNENDRHDVTRFVNLLNRLARDTGAAILLIGHPNKNGDSYSGSTAWLNAVRSQVWLDYVRDGDGDIPDRDARTLSIGKANYAPTGKVIDFRWHNWALVLDTDIPADARAEMDAAIRVTGENSAFLACLRSRAEQGDGREVGPSSGPNYAPSQFEGMPQAKGYNKAALKRAMDRLYEIGSIKSETIRDRKANRDKTIIVEVSGTHNAAHNGCTTQSHNTAQPAAQHATTHTVYTTYIRGAAHEAAAPSPNQEGGEPDYLAGWGSKAERGL